MSGGTMEMQGKQMAGAFQGNVTDREGGQRI